MLRSAPKFVSALAVLIALAIIDLGPRADAGYMSVTAGQSVRDGLELAENVDTPTQIPDRELRIEFDVYPHNPTGGSTTSSSNTRGGGEGPSVGVTQSLETTSPRLVTYLRESPKLLATSHYIASILDPPRA